MKRCIVCGNIGDDDSVVCNICGNPFIDMEGEPDDGNDSLKPDERIEEQLKEVLTQVQEDELAAQQEMAAMPNPVAVPEAMGADEPGVTVLPEDDFDPSVPQNAAAEDPVKRAAEAFAKQAAEEPAESGAEAYAQQAAEAFAKRAAEAPAENQSASEAYAKQAVEAPTENQSASEAYAKQAVEAPTENQSASEAYAKQAVEAPVENQRAAEAFAAENETNVQRPARPRRMKSGPQIYGQDSMEEFEGAQGVIRRDVHGGHAGENVVYGNDVQSGPVQPRRRSETVQEQNSAVPPVRQRPAGVQESAEAVNNAPRTMNQQQRPSVQPYAQTPQENRGTSQQTHHHSGKSSGMARKMREASKEALTSPLLLVVALLQTVFLAASVAAIFMRELSYGQIAKLLNLLDLPSQLSGYVSMFQSAMAQLDKGALAINLAIRVPDLLFCLGLWLICILARSSKDKMSGIGFVLVQVVAIVEMIAACVVLLVVLILSVTLVIAAWSGGTQSTLVTAAVTLIGAIVVTMAIVMYFFCYLSTIRIISANARKGERCGKVSVYVAVVHMILAFTGIINILSGIVNLEVTGIAAGVGQLGWMLLFGVWILMYRSTLREYSE
ncbi:MAG: hypothetical protein LUD16_07175 [Lachnospiraceae bacterium]|nr:hypothetical protein [Lachnospiraceae bacterium]